MTPIESYRMVEPQRMSDEELRAMFNQHRKRGQLTLVLKFAGGCFLLYAIIIAVLLIW